MTDAIHSRNASFIVDTSDHHNAKRPAQRAVTIRAVAESHLKRSASKQTDAFSRERVALLAGLLVRRVRGLVALSASCRVRLPFAAVIPACASFDAGRRCCV